MNAASAGVSFAAAEAGWFGDEARPRFGWLHRASTPAALALVIVPPFGYEAVCAHRSLRHLAEDAARAGITAVRFDLDGTGDSAGDDLDPARVEAWLASIDDACTLARSTGAAQLVLAGVRLGATLATLAATRRDDVAGLVLINPVVKGKAFLREARALQAALGLAPPPTPVADGAQELVGFAISAETQAALAAIDLTTLPACPAPCALLIERDDMPGSGALADRLRELGVALEVQRQCGYAEMMFDPHLTVVPSAMLAACIDWLRRRSVAAAVAATAAPMPAARLRRAVRLSTANGEVTETVVAIDAHLCGIVSTPDAAESRRAVVLLNAGGINRIGPNRLYVRYARGGSGGLPVLRCNVSGIGDNPPREGIEENLIYGPSMQADAETIVRWARQHVAERLVVGGLCSAGHYGYKVATAGHPLAGVLAINSIFCPGTPALPENYALRRDDARYQKRAYSLSAWGKLLRGEVALRDVARVVGWRLARGAAGFWRDLAFHFGRGDPHATRAELLRLTRAGVIFHCLYSDEDPTRSMLQDACAGSLGALLRRGHLRVQVFHEVDHAFTPRWSHPLLLAALHELASVTADQRERPS
ncbi:MAG TPA: alpha/beta hydrolase [Rhodanobacteraceae bacterium]|nr:alpha/beta hydrolase [Rhodanobacteraceae bacterium]